MLVSIACQLDAVKRRLPPNWTISIVSLTFLFTPEFVLPNIFFLFKIMAFSVL
jgi:hypothetical protein